MTTQQREKAQELRRCNKCGATKEITLFVKHASHPGGYMRICKECRNRSGSTSTGRRS